MNLSWMKLMENQNSWIVNSNFRCYTTDPNKKWEDCLVPICNEGEASFWVRGGSQNQNCKTLLLIIKDSIIGRLLFIHPVRQLVIQCCHHIFSFFKYFTSFFLSSEKQIYSARTNHGFLCTLPLLQSDCVCKLFAYPLGLNLWLLCQQV